MPTSRPSAVAGSGVAHVPDAVRAEPVDPETVLRVTIVLRPRDPAAHGAGAAHLLVPGAHPATRTVMTRAQVEALYDPGDERMQAVADFAAAHSLRLVEHSRARHDVVLEGTAEALGRAFGVTLHHFRHAGGSYRAHDEPVRLPPELDHAVVAVLGLDDIPLHQPRVAAPAHSSPARLTPAQLERHYRFPDVDASALRIALLQFGGGFAEDDVAGHARSLGIRLPPITAIGMTGAGGRKTGNAPLDAGRTAAIAAAWKDATSFGALAQTFGADLASFMATMEVTMDVELAVALGGGAAIDVYFAPPGTDGWRRAIYAALGEPVGGNGASRRALPAVISISWGDSESRFGATALGVINEALMAASRMGVVVCCASGDRGTSNEYPKATGSGCGAVNTNFPSSSPAVLACGGTTLVAGADAATFAEQAWKEPLFGMPLATGGGMSGFFPRPPFQSAVTQAPVPGTWRAPGSAPDFVGRWVPDVAANAAFASGVAIRVGGIDLTAGGTSAATPLCAALLVRVAAVAGHPLAGLTPWLYAQRTGAPCRDVTVGDNDVCNGAAPFYEAGPGWDACTGLGAPDGERLVAALAASHAAAPSSPGSPSPVS